MTYTYRVNAKYDYEEIEIQTNSAERAIKFMLESAENWAIVTVTNGFTGEVLAAINYDEFYATEEWSLMMLGWMMKTVEEF